MRDYFKGCKYARTRTSATWFKKEEGDKKEVWKVWFFQKSHQFTTITKSFKRKRLGRLPFESKNWNQKEIEIYLNSAIPKFLKDKALESLEDLFEVPSKDALPRLVEVLSIEDLEKLQIEIDRKLEKA